MSDLLELFNISIYNMLHKIKKDIELQLLSLNKILKYNSLLFTKYYKSVNN